MLNAVPTPSLLFTQQPPQHIYVLKGDQVLLPCRVFDNATLIANIRTARERRDSIYTWHYNDVPLTHFPVDLPFSLVNNSHLLISNVQTIHAGRYVCYVENDMGKVRSFTSNLYVIG